MTARDASAHAHAHGNRHSMELDDLCFAYDELPALRHLSLQVGIGECIALMGDNGSGKSTLLKVLCGLLFAQRGSYRFCGEEVSERSMRDVAFAKRLHQRVGFVFQDSAAQLFCGSVEEEIAFGPRQMGLDETEVCRRVDDTLAMLGIEALRKRAPWALSGGEKKRVAIGCVLSMNPDAFCFDEPLASLDATMRSWLLHLLEELKAAGKTLVIATHDQTLADHLADRIVTLSEGRVQSIGSMPAATRG